MYWSTKSAMSRTTRQMCSMNLTSGRLGASRPGSFSSVNQLGFWSRLDLTRLRAISILAWICGMKTLACQGALPLVVADVVVEVG